MSETPTACPDADADALADPVDAVEGVLLDELLDELQAARPMAAHSATAATAARRPWRGGFTGAALFGELSMMLKPL
jgi:ribosomal protein L12E/L44/L45/RPP1/RPP2